MSTALQTPDWCDAVTVEGSPERERFVVGHLDLVQYVARRMATRLPASVEIDDLTHDGIVGLIDAIDRFDPARGVRFRTYAERRVRGAILDGLRKKDWQPRRVRRGQREMEDTLVRLTTERGREVDDEELAAALGLKLAELQHLLVAVNSGPILPLDELSPRAHPSDDVEQRQPHCAVERKQLLEALAEELTRLPGRERQVLELYYHEGLNMKEVGAVLGVTESRVCQLHGRAAGRLRAALRLRLRAPVREVSS